MVAFGGAALMAGMAFAAPVLAATNVADIGNMATVSGTSPAFPTYIVGADAKTSDVAAAINLAAYMAGNVYTTSTVSVSGSAAGSDGVTLRQQLGYTLATTRDFSLTGPLVVTPATRSGRSASFLKDTSISVSSTTYNYYEDLELGQAALTSAYNLTKGDTSTSSVFATALSSVGLQIPSNDVKYRLLFDTNLPYGTNLTGQALTWLGQEYTITGTPSATEIRLSPSAGGQFIAYQQSATVAGYTVKVIAIGTASTDKVGLQITSGSDTQTVSLASGESKTITLGGSSTTISVSSVTPGTGGGAQVLIGAASLVLKDGMEIKDVSGKVLYPNWVVRFGTTGGAYNHLNLTYSRSHTSFTGTTPELVAGTSLSAPMSYFELANIGLEARAKYQLVATTMSQVDLNGDTTNNENGVQFQMLDSNGAAVKVINGLNSAFIDTVAWDNTHNIWTFVNSSGQWQQLYTATAPTVTIQLQDSTMTIAPYNNSGTIIDAISIVSKNATFKIAEPALYVASYASPWNLEFIDGISGQSRFGDMGVVMGSTSVYTYLSYMGDSVAQGDTAGSNTNARTIYASSFGTDLVSASQSIVTLAIPKTQNYWDIVFGRKAGSTTVTGSGTSKTPVRVTADVAKLDTEIADFSGLTTDAVVIGGPAVNKAAAQLLGVTYPAHGASSGITADTALVSVVQNAFSSGHVAVLIAGYEAANTDMAVAVIQAGSLTQTVPKVQISGSVSSPVITPVA